MKLKCGLEVYGIIYKITNKINGKVYIGQTIQNGGFNRRYRNNLEKNTHNEHLKNSIKKYGIDNFTICTEFDIAFSKDELDIKEDIWINFYNSTNTKYGYNNKTGGSKGRPSEEANKKNSESHKGKHVNDETKMKIRESMKNKCKTVICIDTNEIFDSVTEAGRLYRIDKRSISSCCLGKQLTAGGKKWSYI